MSQNSQENIRVRASILIKLHASGLQIYQKRDSKVHLFFRTPPDHDFWILQIKIKLLKTKFLIDGFAILKFHIQIILHSKKISEGLQINLLNHVNALKYTSVVCVACNSLWFSCICLWFVCSRLWLVCNRLWLVCDLSVVLVMTLRFLWA